MDPATLGLGNRLLKQVAVLLVDQIETTEDDDNKKALTKLKDGLERFRMEIIRDLGGTDETPKPVQASQQAVARPITDQVWGYDEHDGQVVASGTVIADISFEPSPEIAHGVGRLIADLPELLRRVTTLLVETGNTTDATTAVCELLAKHGVLNPLPAEA